MVNINETLSKYITDTRSKEFIENHDYIKDYSSQAKIFLNIVIMVKNQEKLILEAINSVYDISDKIWILDTGSTDRTVDVIKENFTDKVIINHKPWHDNYAEMRNYSIKDIPNGEWVFIIDSDEILSSEITKVELMKFLGELENIDSQKDMVLGVRQKSYGSNLIGSPQRIFKKTSGLKFYGYVHEELRSNKIENIVTDIEIYNIGTSSEEYKKFDKYERYNSLLIKNIDIEPENMKWISLLDIDYGIKHLPNYYKKLDYFCKTMLENKNVKYDNVYEIMILSAKISIDMKEHNFSDAMNSIHFAMNYFNNNSIFVYYKYYLSLAMLQSNYDKLYLEFRNDIEHMKEIERNNSYNDISIDNNVLEGILAKILFKREKYVNSIKLIKANNKVDILSPEVNLIKLIEGEAGIED